MLDRLTRFFKIRLLRRPDIREVKEDGLDDASLVLLDWPGDMKKPVVGLTRDTNENPHWTKYRRFLQANDFSYEIFEYHRSDWLEQAKNYDLIVWSPMSGPAELNEIKSKVYILEYKFNKRCFPDYETLLLCDDKIISTYYLTMHDQPVAETFISHDYGEINSASSTLQYPLVSKLFHGSSSRGVSLISSRKRLTATVKKVFSYYGKKTYAAYYRQKNYLYLQKFIEGERLDTRVNIVGNMIFGYFRKPKEGDFRASGSGNIIKEDLPLEAIEVALKTYRQMGKAMLGVDMLRDEAGKYWIIEISPFIGVLTPAQLKIDGVSGAYFLMSDGTLEFRREAYWPQELALKVFFEQNYLSTPTEWKAKYLDPGLSAGKLKKKVITQES